MWVIRDFRAWIRKGKHNGINNSNPPTITTVQVPVTVFTMFSFDNRMTFVIINWIHTDVNHLVEKSLNEAAVYAYEVFQELYPTSVHRFEFESKVATRTTAAVMTKLHEHYANGIRNTIEYVQYLEAIGDQALAGDPTKWLVKDLRSLIRNCKTTGINNNPNPPAPANPNPTPHTNAIHFDNNNNMNSHNIGYDGNVFHSATPIDGELI